MERVLHASEETALNPGPFDLVERDVVARERSAAGHRADDSGTARVWHLGTDLLHLLAAGGWLGSLPPLVFVLWQAREPGALSAEIGAVSGGVVSGVNDRC